MKITLVLWQSFTFAYTQFDIAVIKFCSLQNHIATRSCKVCKVVAGNHAKNKKCQLIEQFIGNHKSPAFCYSICMSWKCVWQILLFELLWKCCAPVGLPFRLLCCTGTMANKANKNERMSEWNGKANERKRKKLKIEWNSLAISFCLHERKVERKEEAQQ